MVGCGARRTGGTVQVHHLCMQVGEGGWREGERGEEERREGEVKIMRLEIVWDEGTGGTVQVHHLCMQAGGVERGGEE